MGLYTKKSERVKYPFGSKEYWRERTAMAETRCFYHSLLIFMLGYMYWSLATSRVTETGNTDLLLFLICWMPCLGALSLYMAYKREKKDKEAVSLD